MEETGRADGFQNDYGDEGFEDEDEDAQYFKPGESSKRRKGDGSRKELRTKKQVNYNEESKSELAGGSKRQAGEDGGSNRFTNSSKRARFNLTQQLNPSSLSYSSLKGANLLH